VEAASTAPAAAAAGPVAQQLRATEAGAAALEELLPHKEGREGADSSCSNSNSNSSSPARIRAAEDAGPTAISQVVVVAVAAAAAEAAEVAVAAAIVAAATHLMAAAAWLDAAV